MTEVAFHFNAPDKVAYACRLLRKATGSGVRVMVTADAQTLDSLDTALWTFSPLDFVAHCAADSPEGMRRASPVLLAASPGEAARTDDERQVLVNLGAGVPAGFERFARVIEVVSTTDEDRALARQRWRDYTERGFAIQRHDLALKDAG